MAARAANAAVRERRRRSTPVDLERIDVLKALTAAEYSRRQFILNFAASRDTQLLVPGQKSAAVKAAEEWVATCFAQNDMTTANNDYFKYMVDARLWATHGMLTHPLSLQPPVANPLPAVGNDVDFPFSFMRQRSKSEGAPSDISSVGIDLPRPQSETFADGETLGPVTTLTAAHPGPESTPTSTPTTPGKQRRRGSTRTAHTTTRPSSEGRRSMSWPSVDMSMKMPKLERDKLPFLVRIGRWSRRESSMSAS
jgi:hypothetical protein